MLTNPDFRELLRIFKKNKVRYLIAGGYAVMKYSEPRFTKDLDKIDIEQLRKAEQMDQPDED